MHTPEELRDSVTHLLVTYASSVLSSVGMQGVVIRTDAEATLEAVDALLRLLPAAQHAGLNCDEFAYAVWMVGNLDTVHDKAAWWADCTRLWEAAGRRMAALDEAGVSVGQGYDAFKAGLDALPARAVDAPLPDAHDIVMLLAKLRTPHHSVISQSFIMLDAAKMIDRLAPKAAIHDRAIANGWQEMNAFNQNSILKARVTELEATAADVLAWVNKLPVPTAGAATQGMKLHAVLNPEPTI
jgi:hypothetical protein